jgi:hypothetical protein
LLCLVHDRQCASKGGRLTWCSCVLCALACVQLLYRLRDEAEIEAAPRGEDHLPVIRNMERTLIQEVTAWRLGLRRLHQGGGLQLQPPWLRCAAPAIAMLLLLLLLLPSPSAPWPVLCTAF